VAATARAQSDRARSAAIDERARTSGDGAATLVKRAAVIAVLLVPGPQ